MGKVVETTHPELERLHRMREATKVAMWRKLKKRQYRTLARELARQLLWTDTLAVHEWTNADLSLIYEVQNITIPTLKRLADPLYYGKLWWLRDKPMEL